MYRLQHLSSINCYCVHVQHRVECTASIQFVLRVVCITRSVLKLYVPCIVYNNRLAWTKSANKPLPAVSKNSTMYVFVVWVRLSDLQGEQCMKMVFSRFE